MDTITEADILDPVQERVSLIPESIDYYSSHKPNFYYGGYYSMQ